MRGLQRLLATRFGDTLRVVARVVPDPIASPGTEYGQAREYVIGSGAHVSLLDGRRMNSRRAARFFSFRCSVILVFLPRGRYVQLFPVRAHLFVWQDTG